MPRATAKAIVWGAATARPQAARSPAWARTTSVLISSIDSRTERHRTIRNVTARGQTPANLFARRGLPAITLAETCVGARLAGDRRQAAVDDVEAVPQLL